MSKELSTNGWNERLDGGKSEFLDRCNYFYLQMDGTHLWPNSKEGDLLKIGKREIDHLMNTRQPVREKYKPIYHSDRGQDMCGNCGEWIEYTHYKYCHECGAEIDWPE